MWQQRVHLHLQFGVSLCTSGLAIIVCGVTVVSTAWLGLVVEVEVDFGMVVSFVVFLWEGTEGEYCVGAEDWLKA